MAITKQVKVYAQNTINRVQNIGRQIKFQTCRKHSKFKTALINRKFSRTYSFALESNKTHKFKIVMNVIN